MDKQQMVRLLALGAALQDMNRRVQVRQLYDGLFPLGPEQTVYRSLDRDHATIAEALRGLGVTVGKGQRAVDAILEELRRQAVEKHNRDTVEMGVARKAFMTQQQFIEWQDQRIAERDKLIRARDKKHEQKNEQAEG
jgi:hypothetical protein